jgi:hypothetical protein
MAMRIKSIDFKSQESRARNQDTMTKSNLCIEIREIASPVALFLTLGS